MGKGQQEPPMGTEGIGSEEELLPNVSNKLNQKSDAENFAASDELKRAPSSAAGTDHCEAAFKTGHERTRCFKTVTRKHLFFIITTSIIIIIIIIVLMVTMTVVLNGNQCFPKQVHTDDGNGILQHTVDISEVQPPCEDGWIWYRNKCYFFSDEEANWTFANDSCTLHHAYLAIIESKPELNFINRHKGVPDHWIGLTKSLDEGWKWVDGHEFNNLFAIHEGANCAYLNSIEASSSRCHMRRKWVCTKKT